MASKRHARRRQCEGKKRYADAASAQRIAAKMARRNADGWWLNVYKCPFCKAYHVGHARNGNRHQE